MINKHNYIEYIIDYYENNLSPTDKEAFLSFLEKNPAIKEEFLEYATIYNTNIISSASYENKDNLLKSEQDEFEKKCIDYIEGFIGKIDLLAQANNIKEKLTTIKLFEKTKLHIPIIKYPDKKSLYHHNTFYINRIARIAVAAAIIGFFYFLFFNSPYSLDYTPRHKMYIVQNKNTKTLKNSDLVTSTNKVLEEKHKTKYNKQVGYKNKKQRKLRKKEYTDKIETIPVKKVNAVNSISIDIIQISKHRQNIVYYSNIKQNKSKNGFLFRNNLFKKTLLATVQYLFKNNIKIKQQANNGRINYFAFNSENINIKIAKR